MKAKKMIALFLPVVMMAIGFASYSFADNPQEQRATRDQKSGTEVLTKEVLGQEAKVKDHKPFTEVAKPEVLEFLNKSWEKGKDKLQQIKGDKIQDWQLINIGDVDIQFVKYMNEEEADSFNKAFFSEERKNSLQIGDRFPALLVSGTSDEAILFWERENGKIVYIELSKSKDTKSINGAGAWSNGDAKEID
ncbi:hypothetical protein ACTNDP_20710 [Paenibacillus barengoltzii]|jgi:hypothetical protein|uniref:hypothetical protein n=1 Tax=Paenibacillus TaxID=44249 RepID=UPI0028FD33D6|nr:hypothetical protein [Paenibacillus sp. 3LSP]MDU0329087.1 hypothetical protein [Paenibacillus sp. 3LSP]